MQSGAHRPYRVDVRLVRRIIDEGTEKNAMPGDKMLKNVK